MADIVTYELATAMARQHAEAALDAHRRIRRDRRRVSRRYIGGQMHTIMDAGTALAIRREQERLAEHHRKLHYWNVKRRERRPVRTYQSDRLGAVTIPED